MIQETAMLFYKIGHYRQSAILMVEAILANKNSAAAWCGLGSSLAQLAMGRASYAELAAQALKQSLMYSDQGGYHKVSQDWLNSLGQEFPTTKQQTAMSDAKLDSLFELLDVDSQLFVNAMEFIEKGDRMLVVMTTGDLGKNRYVPIMLKAIALAWGDDCARAALKRIVRFKASPEIKAALSKLNQQPNADEYNPYLSHAIKSFSTAEETNNNQRNEGYRASEDSNKTIIQPLKTTNMSVLQQTSDVIEKGIQSLGIAPATTRGAQPGQWDFKRGSASIAVGITVSERFPNGYFYVNCVMMDGSTVPAAKKEEFYRTLLETNTSVVNMKLCLSKDYVMLLSNRDANGLDPEEVASVINELSYYADLLDDRLKEQFK